MTTPPEDGIRRVRAWAVLAICALSIPLLLWLHGGRREPGAPRSAASPRSPFPPARPDLGSSDNPPEAPSRRADSQAWVLREADPPPIEAPVVSAPPASAAPGPEAAAGDFHRPLLPRRSESKPVRRLEPLRLRAIGADWSPRTTHRVMLKSGQKPPEPSMTPQDLRQVFRRLGFEAAKAGYAQPPARPLPRPPRIDPDRPPY